MSTEQIRSGEEKLREQVERNASLEIRLSENVNLESQYRLSLGRLEDALAREKELIKQFDSLQQEASDTKEKLITSRERAINLEDKLAAQTADLEKLGQKFTQQFELLAGKILEEKSQRFSQQNKENIELILKPLNNELGEFKKKVEETYDKESKERFSLEKQVKDLMALNYQISEEAKNLTAALKGNTKTQGNWGEAILETILQNSGLEKNRHYVVQEFLRDECGEYLYGPNGKRMQPDVTITYPDDRKIIIDSKVSLLAYEQYFNAELADDRKLALQAHLKSIKTHIDQLSAKQYDGYAKVLDFVIMFVPLEAAYIAAVQADSQLWEYAYKKRILLISSSNLIAALKMIKDLWVRTDQSQNALEIAERGGKLYEKFVNFIGSLEEIGGHLEKSQASYETAMKQLKTGRGNLIGQVEKLKQLGAKANSSIPEKLLKE
ncbi:DNA recombination protein RmuC [Litoribacter alkaliphilus]|uniref:DNA recombination protein RmuC n=1 Tax=Litoribacter ruber TaxID=702568 RepID=A0AAP2G0K4_9BACT|nr:DNA recombination protein RmuC [Litoribacter alkaliphilus]MBS9523009.1 DNA recombination protein RmuC [Litoribacter alkaliphilus]